MLFFGAGFAVAGLGSAFLTGVFFAASAVFTGFAAVVLGSAFFAGSFLIADSFLSAGIFLGCVSFFAVAFEAGFCSGFFSSSFADATAFCGFVCAGSVFFFAVFAVTLRQYLASRRAKEE